MCLPPDVAVGRGFFRDRWRWQVAALFRGSRFGEPLCRSLPRVAEARGEFQTFPRHLSFGFDVGSGGGGGFSDAAVTENNFVGGSQFLSECFRLSFAVLFGVYLLLDS